MKKILVIGSANIDRIMKLDRLPEKGETIGNGEMSRANGGKGAYQAVAAARAGGDVIFSTCLGNDYSANSKILNYKMEGIRTDHIFRIDGVETGTAFILVDKNGENMITVAPGANGKFSREHVDQLDAAISESEYILLQFEIPLDTVKYIIDVAYEKKKKVILNAAPAQKIEDKYLNKLEVLVVNETEAATLCSRNVKSFDEIKLAAGILLEKGPKVVVITMGKKGSYILTTNNSPITVPAFKVEAVDTTAAGDTFCGALAVGLAEGQSIAETVKFASAAAALTVTKMGAQTSIPKKNAIETFISNN